PRAHHAPPAEPAGRASTLVGSLSSGKQASIRNTAGACSSDSATAEASASMGREQLTTCSSRRHRTALTRTDCVKRLARKIATGRETSSELQALHCFLTN